MMTETNENVCKYYRFDNFTQSSKSALEDAFIQSSRELDLENGVIHFCENSDDELPKVDEFENSNKKISKFEGSLLIPNGQDSNDSLFHSICYSVLFLKSGKIDKCTDKEIEELLTQTYIIS